MTTDYAGNIVAVYALSTSDERDAGRVWYQEAYDACANVAYSANMPVSVVAGVVAALSPNNKWERNVTDAENLISTYLEGGDQEDVKVCTYNTMKGKAWRILTHYSGDVRVSKGIKEILNGRKITDFYGCIMGEDTCVVDGHAYNIATGERRGLKSGSIKLNKKVYTDIQDAYRRIAHAYNGMLASQMQAICWTTWRRIHNIK